MRSCSPEKCPKAVASPELKQQKQSETDGVVLVDKLKSFVDVMAHNSGSQE
jgi:hypothetical protein